MNMIYLGEPKVLRIPCGTITIDKVPPKSTYMDRNRSDIVISETFCTPSDEVMQELYESAAKYFKRKEEKHKDVKQS